MEQMSGPARCGRLRRVFGMPVVMLGLLLCVFTLLVSFIPMRTAVQIGADEGFELAKATLCLHGHKLYTRVWNYQPPQHTFLITQLLRRIASVARRLVGIHAICGLGLVLAVLLLHLLHTASGVNLHAANPLAIMLVAFWNSRLNAWLNWKSSGQPVAR